MISFVLFVKNNGSLGRCKDAPTWLWLQNWEFIRAKSSASISFHFCLAGILQEQWLDVEESLTCSHFIPNFVEFPSLLSLVLSEWFIRLLIISLKEFKDFCLEQANKTPSPLLAFWRWKWIPNVREELGELLQNGEFAFPWLFPRFVSLDQVWNLVCNDGLGFREDQCVFYKFFVFSRKDIPVNPSVPDMARVGGYTRGECFK